MMGDKLHTKTTEIHFFFGSNLAKRRFILMFWRYILTFNAKKNIKKITKINDIYIHLTILTEMRGKQLFIFFYEEVERQKSTIVPSDSLPMENGNVESDQRSLTIMNQQTWQSRLNSKNVYIPATANKGRSIQEFLPCKRCGRLAQLWNKTSSN